MARTTHPSWATLMSWICWRLSPVRGDCLPPTSVLDMLEALTLSVVTACHQRLSHPPPDPDTRTYDSCFYRCIHDIQSDRLNCRLPFITWLPNLSLCSLDAAHHHSYFPEGDTFPKLPLIRREESFHCHDVCNSSTTSAWSTVSPFELPSSLSFRGHY